MELAILLQLQEIECAFYLGHFSVPWIGYQVCNSVSLRVHSTEQSRRYFFKAALWVVIAY